LLSMPPRHSEFDESKVQLVSKVLQEIEEFKVREGYLIQKGNNKPSTGSDKWSSYKGLTVDTLAHRGDEGRGYLR
jgi:hypothetical protein